MFQSCDKAFYRHYVGPLLVAVAKGIFNIFTWKSQTFYSALEKLLKLSRAKRVKFVVLGKTNAIIKRPVNKLYPLVTHTSKKESVDNTPFTVEPRTKPKRKAAEVGELRRKFET